MSLKNLTASAILEVVFVSTAIVPDFAGTPLAYFDANDESLLPVSVIHKKGTILEREWQRHSVTSIFTLIEYTLQYNFE